MASSTYYRYTPGDGSTSPAHNLLIGEVVPGRIYSIPPNLVDQFSGHPDWSASTKQAFEDQGE